MKAMIFAAGFGTRLRPLTLDTPKALIKVQGRPMLDWVVEKLIRSGVNEIVINTHYLHSVINDYIANRAYAVPITLSHETIVLGTGGGLNRTRDFWDQTPFLVHNVDILCSANLGNLRSYHEAHGAVVTLAVNEKQSASMLLVDENGLLVGRSLGNDWQVFQKAEGSIRKVGFCGFQIISPVFWDLVPPPMSFSIIDDYMMLLQKGETIATWPVGDSFWADIGTVEALKRAEADFTGDVG